MFEDHFRKYVHLIFDGLICKCFIDLKLQNLAQIKDAWNTNLSNTIEWFDLEYKPQTMYGVACFRTMAGIMFFHLIYDTKSRKSISVWLKAFSARSGLDIIPQPQWAYEPTIFYFSEEKHYSGFLTSKNSGRFIYCTSGIIQK